MRAAVAIPVTVKSRIGIDGQETFITITNAGPQNVVVHVSFINGDATSYEYCFECDFLIPLSGNDTETLVLTNTVTGTGISIAANKVPGIRAALCGDAETARGARRWNDANVVALSLRSNAVNLGVVGYSTDQELLALRPDFPERGRLLVRRYVKFEELVDRIAEGLRAAGLACS